MGSLLEIIYRGFVLSTQDCNVSTGEMKPSVVCTLCKLCVVARLRPRQGPGKLFFLAEVSIGIRNGCHGVRAPARVVLKIPFEGFQVVPMRFDKVDQECVFSIFK